MGTNLVRYAGNLNPGNGSAVYFAEELRDPRRRASRAAPPSSCSPPLPSC